VVCGSSTLAAGTYLQSVQVRTTVFKIRTMKQNKIPALFLRSLLGALLFTGLSIGFWACQKSNSDKEDNNQLTEAQLTAHADDQAQFSADMDAIADDASIVLEASGIASKLTDLTGLICNATADVDTSANPWKITVTYSGLNCLGTHSRTGVVVISTAPRLRWATAGTAITITAQNLKITRVSDNKSITLNGAQTYTNTSGGLLIGLSAQNSITHTITSNGISVKFDDNSTRTWQVAKRRVFTYNNGVVITSTGIHTEGNQDNIAEWGTNRFGGSFTSATTAPIVIRQDCSFRITSGQLRHVNALVDATLTLGLNAAGLPTTCPGNNPYYYKLSWTGPAGNTYNVIGPY